MIEKQKKQFIRAMISSEDFWEATEYLEAALNEKSGHTRYALLSAAEVA